MKNLHDLGNLTIKEILIGYVGIENAEKILSTIQQGIKEGLQGEELSKLIDETLCNLFIENPKEFEEYLLIFVTIYSI